MKLLPLLVKLVVAVGARLAEGTDVCGGVPLSAVLPRPADRSRVSYAVMFDAGSTGTRIHVYAFVHTHADAFPVLDNETFHSVKPGLSAHIHSPETAAQSVRTLLKVAESAVPRQRWESTPVLLRATAGLRLMSADKAQALLRQVQRVFDDSPFLVPYNSVGIMDGTSEGILAWITVNFLSGHLHAHNKQTVGILDLGGASTQITFLPKLTDCSVEKAAPDDDVVTVDVLNSSFELYTHSYLGNGLMSARLSTLRAHSVSGPDFKSPCLPKKFRGEWSFGGETYQVSGDPEGASGYKACYENVLKTVKGIICQPLHHHHPHLEAQKTLFYAFSFYFDRAVEAHLIDEIHGGRLRVRDFTRSAKEVCKETSEAVFSVNPFLCLDLTYISCLLTDGLGFRDDAPLRLSKKVNNMEASWALGATLAHFENLHLHHRGR
ncbi:ectonucleoside triphosphate diphosphohydrolase 5-like isoform X2 [Phyllopteryx taeniolatus]|uniref:ectonucleoside triphosphate diphosphohydrolase 5-like isoform X2 n=1 Tax=Phyllopteryx taeniolatus TaxID=161469 RepID=UPI002AD22091|nr:ectonucleoside triphosphate diphosphohydrolase 5-like isoform X2 [Phyllopteryx taeniolatus]